MGGIALRVVLESPEVRRHLLPAPPGATRIAPPVVLLGRPPHEEEPVDAARSAEHPARREIHAPAVEGGLGLGRIGPVQAAIVVEPPDAEGDRDPERVVLAPRFDEQHRAPPVLAQPGREGAPRGAGADDDVVVAIALHPVPRPGPPSSRSASPAPLPRSLPRPQQRSGADAGRDEGAEPGPSPGRWPTRKSLRPVRSTPRASQIGRIAKSESPMSELWPTSISRS